MIRLLLSNTILKIKLNNVKSEPFESNIASPQGDALSCTLFNICFEHTLSNARSFFNVDETLTFPQEAIYADDADFITTDKQKREDLKSHFRDILLEDDLKVSESKTKAIALERKIKVPYRCEKT